MNPAIARPTRLCKACRVIGLSARLRRPSSAHCYSSTSSSSRDGRPLRMAVIGSGPAGFYTAYRVMSKVPAKVDMYEALPVPFGLVRFGVAPDHPEVKNCQEKFEEVAQSPDFRFVGNVSVGRPAPHAESPEAGGSGATATATTTVPLPTLLRHYDAVVFAYGASRDRALGVPGEATLRGVHSAREFVGWYNGLPEHAGLAPDLTRGEEAVTVGQGNVALDVARMLLEDVDVLRRTDISEAAVEALSRSRVKRVHVVGRRGPMQAAFTIKEVRELTKLRGVGLHPFNTSLVPPDLKTLPRARRRLMEVLLKGSTTPLDAANKSWSLDFCLSPVRFVADDAADPSRVAYSVFERTRLSAPFDANAHATPVVPPETVEMPSALVFRSIGYRSEALPGFAELDIPFDERRGTILNDGAGRVAREVRTAGGMAATEPYPGLYCAGWVKRGPTGVIASTMEDAFATGDAIAADWTAGAPFLGGEGGEGASSSSANSSSKHGWDGVVSELGGSAGSGRVVTWEDWRRIDEAEVRRGERLGKTRSKFTRIPEMLAVLE